MKLRRLIDADHKDFLYTAEYVECGAQGSVTRTVSTINSSKTEMRIESGHQHEVEVGRDIWKALTQVQFESLIKNHSALKVIVRKANQPI